MALPPQHASQKPAEPAHPDPEKTDPDACSSSAATAASPSADDKDAFPDGGARAWLVAAGAAGAFFCTLGYTNAFGIFQAYYTFEQLPNEGADRIAWIGSVQAFLMFATGAVGGPLFDRYGAWVVRPAAVLYVFAIMMTSICTRYWHFMLAQGILTGLANGLVMFPALAAVPQWFDKRRGAAMGIAVAGSSIGAVVFPIMLSNLLTRTGLGFGWSVRIVGFVMVPGLALSALAIRSRFPPRRTRFFLWHAFRDPMYDLLVASFFFAMIGMFVPLFLIPTYAITRGMGDTLASYLVAIINGASVFGRVIPGVVGDKLGRINILATAAASTAILVFCWPYAQSNAAIIAFSALFGFFSGAIISGGSVAVTMCVDRPENVGTYMGVGMALASFSALVGPPVSGSMVERYHGFHELSYFSGTMTLFGALLAVVAKLKSPIGLLGKT